MANKTSGMMEYIKKSKINNKLKEAVVKIRQNPERAKLASFIPQYFAHKWEIHTFQIWYEIGP